VYNWRVPQPKKPKKKLTKTRKSKQTKLIIETDEDGGGMLLDKEEVQIIYNALREYKPTEKEEHLHSVLLEQFEEILVVDYNEPSPDAN
jgi:hypothetical protein